MSRERDDRRGGPPPNCDELFSVKIDNVASSVREDDLRDQFKKFGEIGDIFIPQDRNRGGNRGFAFVRYVEQDSARDAVDEMQDVDIGGRRIAVCEAQNRKPKYDPNYRNRDRGGGYGDRRGSGGGRYDDRRGSGGGRYDDRRRRSPSPRRRSPSPRRDRRGSYEDRRRSRSRSRSPPSRRRDSRSRSGDRHRR